MTEAFFGGYFTALSLILAIGAQNAFVLRQGLRREYVGMVVLCCALSDAVLIGAGVAGFGAVNAELPWFEGTMRWLGAGFLLIWGGLRFRAAAKGGEALRPAPGKIASRPAVLASCLLLTWANPHVYLDTVVLLGSVSVGYAPWGAVFAIGGALASLSFFMSLGYGARFLAPFFANSKAWVWLEVAVGFLMWAIALALIFG